MLYILLAAVLCCSPGFADDEAMPVVTVADPYIELHSGPGRGYPILHVAEKGESVTILKRRTDWFKVRTQRGKVGWVKRRQMKDTLGPDGRLVDLGDPTIEDFLARRWEFGVTGGDFEGADSLSISLGYRFSDNISAEPKLTQATGNISDSKLASVALLNQPFPEWRLSPYFMLGASRIKTDPSATLVATEDRSDNALLVGLGAYYYISRRMMLRLEYNNHLILTSREENEEVNEWKAGLSVFF